MGSRDWAHEWQWRARNGIGYEQLKAIRKETMEMLEKHGIRADSPVPELEKQIEEAYRSLDDRIVRLCGRQPYAEDLFSAKKRHVETRKASRKQAPYLPRLPPKQQSSGGMKPAF